MWALRWGRQNGGGQGADSKLFGLRCHLLHKSLAKCVLPYLTGEKVQHQGQSKYHYGWLVFPQIQIHIFKDFIYLLFLKDFIDLSERERKGEQRVREKHAPC